MEDEIDAPHLLAQIFAADDNDERVFGSVQAYLMAKRAAGKKGGGSVDRRVPKDRDRAACQEMPNTTKWTFAFQKNIAALKKGFSALQKYTVAMRLLAYAMAADAVEEYL
ncbi:hypothetical protein BDK51DRAFT_27303 [Blyttiomyces helicus]|uniref:Uncharacterized protein n=1 Tax=Blyttiomyces helicus TaxID=388810 RepID=A0A4P9WNT8_9FUNG|nr:hypothetical protein BDK51DRAFT_27303 [Blyttiomyces helicus]|eukprot:RKO92426.1 hypothetical protein BDK51DRAFT_27303 [Blyttiomyces helicus]